jgi:quinol monooxygenase YgiN
MDTNHYAIYTKFITIEENRDTLIGILIDASKAMEKIEECKLYIVNEDAHDRTVTWVTELWAEKQAHDESLNNDAAMHLISRAMPLLTSKPEQIVLNPVSGKGL